MEKKRVLVADDEPDILHILTRYLEIDGYQVTPCPDGKDAYEKIAQDRFDLLILDVMMPGINGWEICRKVKDDPQKRDIPVLILTARSQNTDALMSYECGADEYATKPFDYQQLSGQIKKLIAKE